MVSFTGSTLIGQRIAQLTATSMKKVSLELGGKNADGGFGGPLCPEPYSQEIADLVKNLLT